MLYASTVTVKRWSIFSHSTSDVMCITQANFRQFSFFANDLHLSLVTACLFAWTILFSDRFCQRNDDKRRCCVLITIGYPFADQTSVAVSSLDWHNSTGLMDVLIHGTVAQERQNEDGMLWCFLWDEMVEHSVALKFTPTTGQSLCRKAFDYVWTWQ